jgi:branched-subunit amino acid aminotransferase/4-amino-4-deoxychorismate lyase
MVDGRLVPDGEEALVGLDDGLVRGDGVFEGMRLYGRRPRTLEAHLERLTRSAAAIDLPLDAAVLREELARVCAEVTRADCAVRLMVTRGGHRIWREEPLPPASPGLRLLPVPHRPTPALAHAKTLSYAANMAAQRRARAAGCDDALLVAADDGRVLEGPTSAFGWIEDGALTFPPLELGVLDSITRRLAAEAATVRERAAVVGDLAAAEGAVVLSTVMEAQPVAEVAGVARFDPEAPAVRAVCAGVREVVARHLEG